MKKISNLFILFSMLAFGLITTSCDDDDSGSTPTTPPTSGFIGAVYAMSNGSGQVDGSVQGDNWVASYGRNSDGSLDLITMTPTGGQGGDFDGGEGLDPLISAYALTKSIDNNFVLAVNAGSNTITSLIVQEDFSLSVGDTQPTGDVGPNSIAHAPSTIDGRNGLVYVSNITREEFAAGGEPVQQGSVTGYWLLDDGSLMPIPNSRRELANRPSAVQFSPNGDFLVVTSINSGSVTLASQDENEVVVYTVNDDGTLSADIVGSGASTLRDNTEGRNLPSAIGFQVVGDNYVVVTEAREFQPDGTPPVFPGLQDGSVSTWQIGAGGSLAPINMDVASGENNTGRTACWLDFNNDGTSFFVTNAIEAGVASYSFNNGNVALIDQVAAQGQGTGGFDNGPEAFASTEGWIDMWISDDGNHLYVLQGLRGAISVYEINGTSLSLVEVEAGVLPANNVQGIVAF